MRNEILSIVQKNFPLSKRPFLDIADKTGLSENQVIDIMKEEKRNGIIRQTSAIFNTKSLGYNSSLVAFKIDEKNLLDSIKVINSHPGVSHNYERDHEFNVWFTIAVEPDSQLGLEKSVQLLAKLSCAKEFVILPTLKLFKIAVKLDTTGKEKKREKVEKSSFTNLYLTPLDIEIIKLMQNDIKIVKEPFLETINTLNISYETLFHKLHELKKAGVMRRFATILNHRKAGFNANAMTVWDVDEDIATKMGEKAASFSAVSHCYLRPKYPNWPYNLFTMIHGKTKEETDEVIKQISQEIKYNKKTPLYSTREFKKVRLNYFSPLFKSWEEQYIGEIV